MPKTDKEFNQIKYQNEYNKQNYDRFQFMAPKGTKEIIKAAARSAGQSVSEYILQALKERMEREQNWDPDFTKLTPNERIRLENAENGEYINAKNINWDE